MISLVFHHDYNQLPASSANVIPVQLYGLSGRPRGDISTIGSPVVEKLKRLGVMLPPTVIDFLSIALAVTAADTFVNRKNADDGWARQIELNLPLNSPAPWLHVKRKLEQALHFLSGDIWQLEFSAGGFAPPTPYRSRNGYKVANLFGLDSVCLFSGGLDSAVGIVDLIQSGRKPLLVSHSYKGDKSHQDKIAKSFRGRHERFSVNAYPISAGHEPDISMRTRSFNFLAFATVACGAIQAVGRVNPIDLFVPENGFISLNAPITSRRIGSLSTRTTHPYFMSMIQDIFDEVGIGAAINNPYQFKTKGEMVADCQDSALLASIVSDTVSCSHWKRRNQQCGCCVPCLIRRASILAGGLTEVFDYQHNDLTRVLADETIRDDLLSMIYAISQADERALGTWIVNSGPLPQNRFNEFKGVFGRGLEEVERFLRAEGLING